MKFREHDNLTPVTLVARSPEQLDGLLTNYTECENGVDVVDLQFSSYFDTKNGSPVFSALALVKNKEKKSSEGIAVVKEIFSVSKRMEIAGAHYLDLPYESKCKNLHGHNWIVTVHCRANKVNEQGMICDFAHIKKRVHDRFDHQNINEVLNGLNPTAENIAKYICGLVPHCYKVEVQESEGNVACYELA